MALAKWRLTSSAETARLSSYKKHGKKSPIGRAKRKIEYAKSQVRAKVEHPFRVIKIPKRILWEAWKRVAANNEHINAWRQACIAGQQTVQVQQKVDREQARKDKKRIQDLERELRRKDKALAEKAALLVLRKKLNDYWGTDNEDN